MEANVETKRAGTVVLNGTAWPLDRIEFTIKQNVVVRGGGRVSSCCMRLRAGDFNSPPGRLEYICVKIEGEPTVYLQGPWRLHEAAYDPFAGIGATGVWEVRYAGFADGWFTITQEA